MSHVTNKTKNKLKMYLKRKLKVNTKIKSHKSEYRIIINKSNLYISAQVVDLQWNILANINDKKAKGKTKIERAKLAGEEFGKQLLSKKIETASFDRNGFLYHGRVKAFADWLRNAGLKI